MNFTSTSPIRGRLRIALALAGALWLTTGAAQAYTVRDQHPRVLLTPAIVAELRARAAAGSPRWLALKQSCDKYITSTSIFGADIRNYALAYQVTGETRYADKAIALALSRVEGGMDVVTTKSGYNLRHLLPEVALAYDWCYDRLTPAQRERLRSQMEQWVDWTWPDTNPVRTTAWGVHNPGSNFYHGFMMSWLVGLALHGDSPKAPSYINLARTKWLEHVRPYLEKYGAGGYMLEGTNYGTGSAFRIFWYLAAHQTATGENLLNVPGFHWARDFTLAKLYLTTPGMARLYPGGNQSRDKLAPLSDYDRGGALAAISFLDPSTAGYARWWLDHMTPNQNRWHVTRWEEFLWYREDVPAIDYTQSLPHGYLASGAGWMTSRSDWGPDATYVAMMCGPTKESHQDLAQNGFMIFRKEWLAAAARLTGGAGLLRDAASHNSMTFGGRQQPDSKDGLPKELPKVIHFADTDRYAYFVGEAKDAYSYWKWPDVLPVLNGFRRHLLFLKPHRVVVFDRVDIVDPTQVKTWHFNTLTEPVVRDGSYQASVGGSTIFGTSLLPVGAKLEKVPINLGVGGALSSWRVNISAPVGQKLDLFLNVLETAPASQAAPTPARALQTGRDGLVGAQIGAQVVLFDANADAHLPVTYQTRTPEAEEHFVMNQDPLKWYRVVIKTDAGPGQELRIQATDQGVLPFRVNAGAVHSVGIYPAGTGGEPGVPVVPPPPAPGPDIEPQPAPQPVPVPVPVPTPAPQPTPAPGPAPAPPAIPPLPPAAFGYIN